MITKNENCHIVFCSYYDDNDNKEKVMTMVQYEDYADGSVFKKINIISIFLFYITYTRRYL